jgi:hypothetical protein
MSAPPPIIVTRIVSPARSPPSPAPVSVPSQGFASVQQADREAALSLSYTSTGRPIVSLDDLSSLECALIGATATTKAMIASKGNSLRALPADDLPTAVETIRAFAAADLNVAKAAEQAHVHPNTIRYPLHQIATKTGHDPRTFTGLVDLICILEITDNEHQAEVGQASQLRPVELCSSTQRRRVQRLPEMRSQARISFSRRKSAPVSHSRSSDVEKPRCRCGVCSRGRGPHQT